ncbi:hypothetical protein [Naasia sp. SYSU D00948]|uniref:hypothetical protein n=1 Tax=Naasia sp. SYSU D00948 TaxID=2817379 RepID=UPI001B316EE2|nr:hypothetical protein [Naasia sp. SYSU D00948]
MLERGWRRLLAAVSGVAILASGLVAVSAPQSAEAANAWDFRPGNIISDAVFFNNTTMTAQQVQDFLNAKVPNCRGTTLPCLKNYTETTWTRAADPMCGGYNGAANESAAMIIWRVGQACGINPQVLIVLLEKEQGLVTDSAPTARKYRSATGYGCPDTAPCDAEFYGFYNQVFKAAWAFKRYAMPPGTGPGTPWNTVYSRYRPGATAQVQYHPNTACGSSAVFIENQATASLYFYTPYQPNNAALAAGYGLGDSCSAYGNRNFFMFFTDWFGTSRYPVLGALREYYDANGGRFGWLGEPTAPEVAAFGGWRQTFEGGSLFVQPGQPVIPVRGSFSAEYARLGFQGSALGWPLSPAVPAINGGSLQEFQGGAIYHDGVAAYGLYGAIGTYYRSIGAYRSALGWPIGRQVAGAAGDATQSFQGGTVRAEADGSVSRPGGRDQRAGTAFVDVDGDGVTDMFGRTSDGRLIFYRGGANGALLAGREVGSGWNIHSWIGSFGDGNADGVPDLWGREARTGALWFYPLTKTGAAASRANVGIGWNTLDALVTPGDVTGDGIGDAYGRDIVSGALYVYVGDGAGGFSSRSRVNEGWGTFNAIVPVGDVTGDGAPDLLGRVAVNGNLMLYRTGAGGAIVSGELINRGWGGFDILLGGNLPGAVGQGLIVRDPSRGNGTLRRYLISGTTIAPGQDFNVGWNIYGVLF